MYRKWIAALCVCSLFFVGTSVGYAAGNDEFTKLIPRLEGQSPETQSALLEVAISATKYQIKTSLLKKDREIPFTELEGYKGLFNSIAFDPSGKYLATVGKRGTIKLWERETWNLLRELSHHKRGGVNSVSFSPNGQYLVSGSDDGMVSLYDIQQNKVVKTITSNWEGTGITVFSPDNRYLAFYSVGRNPDDETLSYQIHVQDFTTDQELTTISSDQPVITLSFHPSGKYLTAAFGNNSIKIWDTTTWDVCKELEHNNGILSSVCFSPDGRHLSSGTTDGIINLWDVTDNFRLFQTMKIAKGDPVCCTLFSPDGNYLFSGSKSSPLDEGADELTYTSNVQIWEVSTGQLLREIFNKEAVTITSMAISPDFKHLAIGPSAISSPGSAYVGDIFDPADSQVLSFLNQSSSGLNAPQKFLLCALAACTSPQRSLSEIEADLKDKYGQRIPELLNLKESFDSLSPESQTFLKERFNVTP